MKKIYILFIFVISTTITQAQNFGFAPAPPFPANALGRDDASLFVIGNKAYVGLGLRDGFSLGDDFMHLIQPRILGRRLPIFHLAGNMQPVLPSMGMAMSSVA